MKKLDQVKAASVFPLSQSRKSAHRLDSSTVSASNPRHSRQGKEREKEEEKGQAIKKLSITDRWIFSQTSKPHKHILLV